jgi:hypothetical protein
LSAERGDIAAVFSADCKSAALLQRSPVGSSAFRRRVRNRLKAELRTSRVTVILKIAIAGGYERDAKKVLARFILDRDSSGE